MLRNFSFQKISILSVLIFITACENNKNDNNSDDQSVMINLIDTDANILFEKTVIIFESEQYLVKSPLNYFISDLDDFIFNDYDSYLSIIDSIISDGETQNILFANNYFEDDRLEYLLAHFLQSGNCYLYDKINSINIQQIRMERFSCRHPLAGSMGRDFYIDENLFLEIIDGIC
jgi:hypothetical protein